MPHATRPHATPGLTAPRAPRPAHLAPQVHALPQAPASPGVRRGLALAVLLLALAAATRGRPALRDAAADGTPAAPPAAQAQRLVDHVRPLAKGLLERERERATVLEGPQATTMKNDRSPGRTWQARLGSTTFRVTTQDTSKVGVEQVLEHVQRLPARYRRCLEIVSEPEKAGVAVYAELGGAAAHGGQEYLNMIPEANVFVMLHEAGHILEQRATAKQPDILARWAKAAAADKISVSEYGDSVTHEDQAEFSLVYGIALDAGPEHLEALKALSPRRFALWEQILVLAGARAPGAPGTPAPAGTGGASGASGAAAKDRPAAKGKDKAPAR